MESGQAITSYLIKALFTPVPVDPAISIVQQKLQQDPVLSQRDEHVHPPYCQPFIILSPNTCFLFQGKYYEQIHGAARGSSISPLIANLFMEEFEIKAINSTPHSPHLWFRFVDNAFVIQQAEHTQQHLQHINSHDPHIQFTSKGTQPG